jgi:hypothetical protein
VITTSEKSASSSEPSEPTCRRRRLRRVGATVAALALALATSWPASAEPVPPPVRAVGGDHSRNWAGYAATGDGFTAVSGTWAVPEPSTEGEVGTSATWVGIGGVTADDLIQAGTGESVAGGRVEYQAWVETLPRPARPVPLAVHPGDTVVVSITEVAQDSWSVVLANSTSGERYERTVPYHSSYSSAEWIEEAPFARRQGILPLDAFGTVHFADGAATKDGQSLDLGQLDARPITMYGPSGQSLAVPSPLGSDGASFDVVRTAAPNVLPRPGVWLGITRGPADEAGGDGPGVMIERVVPGGPAAGAGVLPGDVLTAVDGQPVDDLGGLVGVLGGHQPGDRVVLSVSRGGQTRQLPATLQPRPADV